MEKQSSQSVSSRSFSPTERRGVFFFFFFFFRKVFGAQILASWDTRDKNADSKRIREKKGPGSFYIFFSIRGTLRCLVETLNITKTKQSSLLPVCWMLVFAEKEEGGKVSVVVCLMNK
jgi:hypothetical protein